MHKDNVSAKMLNNELTFLLSTSVSMVSNNLNKKTCQGVTQVIHVLAMPLDWCQFKDLNHGSSSDY
jgi:hypothetical protein